MRLIAHRGNLLGPRKEKENNPIYVLSALNKSFECEVDLRVMNGKLYLGHDGPDYLVPESFLLDWRSALWIHCKNLPAFEWVLSNKDVNGFWHEQDQFALTTKFHIWTAHRENTTARTVLVDNSPDAISRTPKDLEGLCGDYVGVAKDRKINSLAGPDLR